MMNGAVGGMKWLFLKALINKLNMKLFTSQTHDILTQLLINQIQSVCTLFVVNRTIFVLFGSMKGTALFRYIFIVRQTTDLMWDFSY